jgi:PAS domain S-box-containing protein
MPTGPTIADFRTMIESAPEAIIVYTPEKFLYLNPVAANRLGADSGSLVGEPIMQFVHPESVPQVIERISGPSAAAKSGIPLDVRFVARDGTIILAEIVSVPIVFEGRKAILGLIRDISRRAEAERALRESEEKFGNAFRHSPHGMAFVSVEGRWLKANRALCEMLGYSEEELLQQSITDVTHPDDIATDLEQLRRLVAREISNYQRMKRYLHKDGRTIWVSLAVSVVHTSDGLPAYFIGQMQDVTLQKEMQERSLEAQHLAGVAETATAVAHEMNNVLTVLLMNAELLAQEATAEEIPGIASEILAASTRIAATVQRLRDAANLKSVTYLGERKMIDLSAGAGRAAPTPATKRSR